MSFEAELKERLLESFRIELQEHIQAMTDGLLVLEQSAVEGDERQATLNKVFRAAHSLKGAARTVEATTVTQLAHALEDILDRLRKNTLEATPELYTHIYQTLDVIQIVQGTHEAGEEPSEEVEQVLETLAPYRGIEGPDADEAAAIDAPTTNTLVVDAPPAPQPEATTPEATSSTAQNTQSAATTTAKPKISRPSPTTETETIRVNVNKLDALMAQLSELLITKIRADQRLTQLRQIEDEMGMWQKDWLSTRSAYSRVTRQHTTNQNRHNGETQYYKDLDQIFEYVNTSQEQLREVTTLLNQLSREYANDTMQMGLVIDELEEEVKRVRMLPLGTILRPFGRMVRDVAYEMNKEVVLQVEGAETELDKRVLEQIKDPLIHLLRNAVDHGIESPDTREVAGKTRHGTITLSAEQAGKDVIISIRDDGQGLDIEAIRRAVAKQRGPIAQEMTEAELAQTIYEVGVSTSQVITDVSGRGVGMDIVRRNVAALRGRIDLDWAPNTGTTFTLTLPLTLSSGRGLLVKAGTQRFAIPLNTIERLMPLTPEALTTLGGNDAIDYHGKPIPLVHLADVLELPRTNTTPDIQSVLILAAAERRLAFVVDGLFGEQEIVSKALGQQLPRVQGLSGATVMGDGDIVLVLNVADLITMALQGERHAIVTSAENVSATPVHIQRQLLIVDDSITTRTLEKNILEAAGYSVQLATNGQEAWDTLSTGDVPDLVVSDVSMPRMTGIELTRHIKNDPRTAQLPVILVTSLDSPTDKARGIEAGADAYITKGSFDQNNLLRTVRQLI